MPENEIAISDLTFTLIAGTVSFVVITIAIVAMIVAFQQKKILNLQKIQDMEISFQKQLLQSRLEVQEETSSLLAKELHDNVGQLLTGTKLLMGLAERQIENQVTMPDTMSKAQQSLEKAIRELRSLSKVLDADWISRFSFSENLEQQVHRINEMGMVQCSLSLAAAPIPLSAEKQVMLFRIVQEGVQNALKHSGCNILDISVAASNNEIKIELRDNGHGIQPENTSGMGLNNMAMRTGLLGGNINIDSTPETGTTLTIIIPSETRNDG